MRASTSCNRSRGCVLSIMTSLACRAWHAWEFPFTVTVALVLASAMGALSVAAVPVWGAETDASALGLNDAADLAVATQPLLDAQRSAVNGLRETAVTAGQLPDPTLIGGLADLTITSPDRFGLRQETDTQFMFAVKQSFPGGKKRGLRSARARAEFDRLSTELDEQIRMVRREAGLAWLDVWKVAPALADGHFPMWNCASVLPSCRRTIFLHSMP